MPYFLQPVSDVQLRALRQLAAVKCFTRSVAGWGPPDAHGLGAFQTTTLTALSARGLISLTKGGGRVRTVTISMAGRSYLATLRTQQPSSPPDDPHHRLQAAE